MSQLIFDEESHVYRVKGVEIPSVTTLLQKYGVVNTEWYGEQAKVRGTHVHKGTEFIDDRTLDWDRLDPILTPYLRAYDNFTLQLKHEILQSELRMYDPENWYAGTLDRIISYFGKIILYDIKSGAMPPKWVHLQLAGYWNLCKIQGIKIDEFYVLQLRSDGTYIFERVPTVKIIEGWKEFQAICLVDGLSKKYA